jgi:hypothetical protein
VARGGVAVGRGAHLLSVRHDRVNSRILARSWCYRDIGGRSAIDLGSYASQNPVPPVRACREDDPWWLSRSSIYTESTASHEIILSAF